MSTDQVAESCPRPFLASAPCVGGGFGACWSARARAVREPYGPHGSRLPHACAENGRDSAKPLLERKRLEPLPHSCDKDGLSCRTSARRTAEIPQNPSWEPNFSNRPSHECGAAPAARAPPAGDDAEKVMDPYSRAAGEAPQRGHRFQGRPGVPSVRAPPVSPRGFEDFRCPEDPREVQESPFFVEPPSVAMRRATFLPVMEASGRHRGGEASRGGAP